MKVFETNISEQDALYLMRLEYESTGYRSILSWILNHQSSDHEAWQQESFQQLSNTATKVMLERSVAITEMTKKYVPAEFCTERHTASFDFDKKTVTVDDNLPCA